MLHDSRERLFDVGHREQRLALGAAAAALVHVLEVLLHEERAVREQHCDIPDGTQIGVNLALDRERFDVTPRGVVLVTPEALLASTIAKG